MQKKEGKTLAAWHAERAIFLSRRAVGYPCTIKRAVQREQMCKVIYHINFFLELAASKKEFQFFNVHMRYIVEMRLFDVYFLKIVSLTFI